MPQVAFPPTVVRFADFEVDVRAGELRKRGRRIRLQEQPFRVLSMLLERPGEAVGREELRQKLWPADTFVDFDHGLNSAVARLRETLNDSAEDPRFVETVPKRGYRFIGAVEETVSLPLDATVPAPIPEVQPRVLSRVGMRSWIAVVAVLLVLLLLAGIKLRQLSRGRGDAPLEIIPMAVLPGYEVEPAFSPDGNQVAFREINGHRNSGVYTALVGGDSALRLTNNPGDCCAAWSPDSRQVAFVRRSNSEDDIYVVPAIGGTERKLFSSPRDLKPHLAWSPDGKVLAFPENDGTDSRSWITLLSLFDSSTRRLTTPPAEDRDDSPAFSPDGSQVAFIRGPIAGVVNNVYVMSTKGGEPRRLTFENRPIFGLTWSADSSDLIYSSIREGPTRLWRVSASGGVPRAVAGVGLMAYSPSVPAKGNELAYRQAIGKDNIWRITLKDGKHLLGPPNIAIAAKGRKLRPNFSPDGKRIAFESDRLGSMEIWACDSNGRNCAQLTSLHGTAGTARWSPDGRYIAFEFHPGERAEIYLLDVETQVARLVSTIPGADNLAPSWSRDGRWLYFSSRRGSGPFQIWKTSLTRGQPIQVTMAGGIAAAESGDRRFLYYSKYESDGVWRMPLAGGAEVRVLDQPAGTEWFNWGLASRGIYFLNTAKAPRTTIEFFEFATHRITPISSFDKPWGWGFAVSPDGNSLLYVQSEFEESNIMVVKNFR
jgi:Tol biopolymer transport system component/DNA-binding winged helix-turn-helix (wHTH) protein